MLNGKGVMRLEFEFEDGTVIRTKEEVAYTALLPFAPVVRKVATDLTDTYSRLGSREFFMKIAEKIFYGDTQ